MGIMGVCFVPFSPFTWWGNSVIQFGNGIVNDNC